MGVTMINEHWHSEMIEHIAAGLKPFLYVELGISHCMTLNRASAFAEMIYCCDVNDKKDSISHKGKTKFFKESTDEFFKRWENEIRLPIDMIFIDADHSEATVYRDATNFYNWLRPDSGIMLLHDTWPPVKDLIIPSRCGDGFKAVRKIKEKLSDRDFEAEIVTLPAQYGLTIIRKTGDAWQNG